MKAIALLLAALLAPLAGGCGGDGEARVAPSPERVAAGKDLYVRTCAICHGPEGQGVPALGKDLRGNGFVKGLGDEELVFFLVAGRPANHPLNARGMPPRGGNPSLSDDELGLIGDYLRSIAP